MMDDAALDNHLASSVLTSEPNTNPDQLPHEHADPEPILAELQVFGDVLEAVTMSRVKLQPHRNATSQAREDVKEKELKIYEALHESNTTGKPLKPDEYYKLLASVKAARNKLEKAEKKVEGIEFHLVGKEDTLLNSTQKLRRLIRKHTGKGLEVPTRSSISLPSVITQGQGQQLPRKPSTVFTFESESGSEEQAYFDLDALESPILPGLPLDRDRLEYYAPELNSKDKGTPSDHEGSTYSEDPELYVGNESKSKVLSTNGKEYLEPAMSKSPQVSMYLQVELSKRMLENLALSSSFHWN